jgi:phytoene synthase
MNPSPIDAQQVLARHGRSFHLAARFLSTNARRRATGLYGFCRVLDDLADSDAEPERVTKELIVLRETLHQSDLPACKIYRSLNLLDDNPAKALLLALANDTGPRRTQSADELVRYAHGVAGTVGLMMAEILGSTSPLASPHALDLGIAMQLINISRDVREDARRSRIYLPQEWLPQDVTAASLKIDPLPAWPAVLKSIQLAEEYFVSGFIGLRYLPRESRRGIWLAGRVYREIGREILRLGPAGLLNRTVVPKWRRFALATLCMSSPFTPFRNTAYGGHDPRLHQALDGLCGNHSNP